MPQSDLLYGDTGSTKTSRLGDAAEWFHARTGKPARLVASDTGGWDVLSSLVSAGVVVPFLLSDQHRGPMLIEDMYRITTGWWPKDPQDPTSPLENQRADYANRACALLIDGWTSWCQMMMTFHTAAITFDERTMTISAQNVRVPEMPRDSFIRSGSYVRRFTGRSDYGGVQDRIKEFIRNTAMLPVPVVGTCLESKGSDEQKRAVFGPDFIGSALTGVSGPWFGNMLHLDLIEQKPDASGTILVEPRMFTRPHVDPNDPTRTPYLAKVRVDRTRWQSIPAVMAADLKAFYAALEKA